MQVQVRMLKDYQAKEVPYIYEEGKFLYLEKEMADYLILNGYAKENFQLSGTQQAAIREIRTWDEETLRQELEIMIALSSDKQINDTIFHKRYKDDNSKTIKISNKVELKKYIAKCFFKLSPRYAGAYFIVRYDNQERLIWFSKPKDNDFSTPLPETYCSMSPNYIHDHEDYDFHSRRGYVFRTDKNGNSVAYRVYNRLVPSFLPDEFEITLLGQEEEGVTWMLENPYSDGDNPFFYKPNLHFKTDDGEIQIKELIAYFETLKKAECIEWVYGTFDFVDEDGVWHYLTVEELWEFFKSSTN